MTMTTETPVPFRERTWDFSSPVPALKRHDQKYLKHVPTQQRGWDTLNKIVDAAETVLANPKHGRDNFSIKLVLDELARRDQSIADGTVYTYFDGKLPLLNYIWPERPNDVYTITKELPPVVTDDNEELAASL